MNLVADAAKDIARLATGVGLVAAECGASAVRLKGLGSLAIRARKCLGKFASSEANVRGLSWESVGVAMDGDGVDQSHSTTGRPTTEEEERSGAGAQRAAVPQLEDLFAPHKAAESRPVKSVEPTAGVEPVSQKVALPSVRGAHPPKT